ncbi:MAG: PAS domain S-box protein [Rhodoferax sp.]|nr:PAS domain S-box protein [Rhodoferax sp.]
MQHKQTTDRQASSQALRQRAEALEPQLSGLLPVSAGAPVPDETLRLLHELRIHQIELTMQNEELRTAQLALELERARYFDLYDLAPVAYCSVNDKGLIVQANLTAAALFGVDRTLLLKQAFIRFISKPDQASYYRHGQQLHALNTSQSCQLRMIKPDGASFWVHLVSTLADDEAGMAVQRVVISDITEQRRLGLAARQSEIARNLLQAQEEARRRFSRELHDRTSPNLAALRINLELIIATAPQSRDTQAFTDCVEDTRALLADTNWSIRDICAELHPPALDRGGLLDGINNYVLLLARRTGLMVHVDCPHDNVRLPPELELGFFRIVQESLTNCVKHAQASAATVTLQLRARPLRLSISDNGIGFDPAVAETAGQGQGLRNMRQTVEFLNGHFSLVSAPGCGTQVCIEIEPT